MVDEKATVEAVETEEEEEKKEVNKEEWFRIDAQEFTIDWIMATMMVPPPLLSVFAEGQLKKHKNKTYKDYPLESGELGEEWDNKGREFTEEKCKQKMYSLNKRFDKQGKKIKYLPTGKAKGIQPKDWKKILEDAMAKAGATDKNLNITGSSGE